MIIQHCVIYTELYKESPARVSLQKNLSDEELSQLERQVFPKGTGWDDYQNSRCIKVFPFNNKFVVSYITLALDKEIGIVQRRAWVVLVQPSDLENMIQSEDWIHDIYQIALPLFQADPHIHELQSSLKLYHQPIVFDSSRTKRIRNRVFIKYEKPQDWRYVEEHIRQLVADSLVKKQLSFTTFSLQLTEDKQVSYVGFPSNNPATQETYIKGIPLILRLPLVILIVTLCGSLIFFAFLRDEPDDEPTSSPTSTETASPMITETPFLVQVEFTPEVGLETIPIYLLPDESSQPIYQLNPDTEIVLLGIGIPPTINGATATPNPLVTLNQWVMVSVSDEEILFSGWIKAEYVPALVSNPALVQTLSQIPLDTAGTIGAER